MAIGYFFAPGLKSSDCERYTFHRSHFGSRYTLGCCGHASLFAMMGVFKSCGGRPPTSVCIAWGKLCSYVSGLFAELCFSCCCLWPQIVAKRQESVPSTMKDYQVKFRRHLNLVVGALLHLSLSLSPALSPSPSLSLLFLHFSLRPGQQQKVPSKFLDFFLAP